MQAATKLDNSQSAASDARIFGLACSSSISVALVCIVTFIIYFWLGSARFFPVCADCSSNRIGSQPFTSHTRILGLVRSTSLLVALVRSITGYTAICVRVSYFCLTLATFG